MAVTTDGAANDTWEMTCFKAPTFIAIEKLDLCAKVIADAAALEVSHTHI